jgi:formylglycine-generating enzyme
MPATRDGALFAALAILGCGGAEPSSLLEGAGPGLADSASPGAGAADSAGGTLQDSSAPQSSSCPGATSGPAMVSVGDFCIDSTEVTKAQYHLFLEAAPSVTGQRAYCSWNNSFTPAGQWPPTALTEPEPVTSVDWCDAYAYCAWAGKRLCGDVGSGSVMPTDVNSAAADQWFFACSDDGARTYPYGSTYGPTTCNGGDANGGVQTVDAVESFPGCVGGFPGIYDMSGNVREWEDSCNAALGPGDNCNERGGSVNEGAAQLTCAATELGPRNSSNEHLGLRCCSH